jgi:hypothetical protein
MAKCLSRWDATISLLSRRPRVIPSGYFTALRETSKQDAWTFFDLAGCPADLVSCLVELSDIAAEFEVAKKMRWTKFDPTRVNEIEQFLRDWSDDGFVITDEEDQETMQYKRDCHHCTEAWRNGLIIYVVRVFKSDEVGRHPHQLSYLSRITLDHVRCCRKTSNIQKQLLLPVFLASCETTNPIDREFAKEYCESWNDRSAYGMFSSTASLIDSVWERQSSTEDQGAWWGQILDEELSKGNEPGSIQCLLG